MIDIEHALICTVVATQDHRDVVALGIKPEIFTTRSHRRVFELVRDHLLEHRQVPGEEVIYRAFPSYVITSYPEPVEYYATQLWDQHLHDSALDGIQRTLVPLLAPDAEERVTGRQIHEAIGRVYFDLSAEAPTVARVNAYASLEEYAREVLPPRRKGELRGISTGFQTLDRAIGGYHPQQLITLFGLPKHGKSTMMLKTAMTAVADGLKVLYVTFEMSVDENRDRLISLLADVPLTDWIEGAVPLGDKEDAIYTALRKNSTIDGFLMIEDPRATSTVTSLNQVLLEEQPDIFFVDSAYLMHDELGEPHQSNQALINIVRALKRMAQTHRIPIVISTQALASRSRNGLNAGSIANSSVFRTDSDTLIGVEHKTGTISEFKVVAARQGRNTTCYISIDWKTSTIEEMDPAVAQTAIASVGTATKGKVQI